MQIQAPLHALQRPFQPPLSLQFHSKPSFPTPTKHVPYPLHSHTTTSDNSFIHFSRLLHSVKFRSVAAVAAADEVVIDDGDTTDEPGFVNIGYISSVHGVQGEIRVKPTTDFPQLRFSTPGRRWLKSKVLGGDTIQQVELEEGREHPGLKSWILKFRGIDTVDQAKMLIGATLLVTKEDRPELEEGEFYTHDLIGMRVFMKENGKLVGTVVNVFNSGANDLLQIVLDSSFDMLDKSGKSRSTEIDASSQLVLVPFVEAIVPDVDMKRREMHITPPKGLLEVNLRFDERSKKERRQLEWKERKKFQKRLIAAKKKLCEMEQQHVFHGFQYGEKDQWSLLSNQIVGLNSKLLQEALQSLEQPAKRQWKVAELVSAIKAKLINSIQISEESFSNGSENKLVRDMQEKGLELMSEGKMAIVLLLNEKEHQGSICDSNMFENEAIDTSVLHMLQKVLCDGENFVKNNNLFNKYSKRSEKIISPKMYYLLSYVKDHVSEPLILVSSSKQIQSLRNLFTSNNYFTFDSEKVWFLEEEKLPVVSSLPEGQNKYKILMKSPWEILQSPVGSGGLISLFSKHSIADNLIDMGVEYIELCCPSEKIAGGNSLLLGLINSREATIGVQISPKIAESEIFFDMILSMDFVKKLSNQSNKLQFDAIPKVHSFVEKVDKEWVTVTSSSPNSYELSSSIYSSLNACSLDKVCIVEVRE
uniref:Ribosome maturation factor rimM n=1 Tax=Cajanus cajan TaxID=3821 RepID=A0A151UGW7_CAJCA